MFTGFGLTLIEVYGRSIFVKKYVKYVTVKLLDGEYI